MTTPAATLAVLIATHRDGRWLPAFFESWRASVAAAEALRGHTIDIVVADSGEEASIPQLVAQQASEARTLVTGNLGYGGKINRAAAATNARWLLICNPDLTFPPAFARDLFTPLLDPEVRAEPLWQRAAVIAPRIVNPDGSVQPSIGRFPTLAGLIRDQFRPRQRRKYVDPQPTDAGIVDWATGACLLIRRDVFEEIGGFDEKYFLYVEEVDLQRRLWAKDRPTYFAPEVAVVHHNPNAGRPPRPEVQRYAARGTLRYFAKHGTWGELAGYRLLAMLSGRLRVNEALRIRKSVLASPTGP